MSSTRFVRLVLRATVIAALAAVSQSAVAGPDPGKALSDAAELSGRGRLVQAKRLLVSLDREGLTDEEREKAFELLSSVDRRLKTADPVDISLQKAEAAIAEGNLREADRQANAVKRSDTASPEQRRAATALLEESATAKAALAPMAAPALDQALADFEAGRYSEAKAGLDSVYRSGVELSPAQLRSIDRFREKIAELEQARGEAFAFQQVPLSMFQPGEVTRRTDPAGRPAAREREQGRTEPVNEPEAAPDAGQAVAQASQPESSPPPPPPADSQDLIDEALRFDAQRMIAEADAAFVAGRYREAMDKYQQVAGPYRRYVSAEEATRADNRLAEVRVMLEQAGGGLVDTEIDIRRIRLEQARAEFDQFLADARTRLTAGDTDGARTLVSQARLRLADARDLFAEAEYNQRLADHDALLAQIKAEEIVLQQREASEREKTLAAEAREQEEAQRDEKRRKINEALDRVRALQMEQKYGEALQVVDQILFLDPQDPAGLLLKETLEDVMIYREWDLTQRAKTLSYAREFNRIENAMIAPDNLLDYPPDWPEISVRRGEPSAFTESASDRRVLAELEGKRIPAAFTDNTLEDVLGFIANVTNLNMDVDWQSLADIGVQRDARVTLNLQPLPAKTVLDRVLEKVSPDNFSRANWAINDGVLVVASDSALRKNKFIVIYDVRDLLFQIPSFTDYPELDLDSVLNQRQGGGSGSIFQQEGDTEGQRLTKEELKERLISIIQNNVDFEGWRDNGGDTGAIEDLNDNLIITNTARNHRAISGLLRQLREVRSIQINVEARFLVVSQDFFEQIGFDLDVIFNATNTQFTDALFQQQNYSPLAQPLQPGNRTTLLPSDLIGPQFSPAGTRADSTNEWIRTNELTEPFPEFGVDATSFTVTRPDNWSMIPANQNSQSMVESLISSPFAAEVLALNPALGVAATFLDDIQVDFLIEATQADRRNVELTAPRLTFTNGHAANIYVTTQQSFVSGLTAVVGTNSVGFNPTVSVVSSGFTLSLDGVVSADRRYVTLTIRTALAEVIEFGTATVQAQTGGGTDQGVPSQPITGTFQLPIVQVTSVSTGATIPDRGTLLIGGQRLKSEVEVESGVPVLSKIPIINRFFSNRIESKEEQTLLILVKPTILIQSEEEEKNFPGLLDSLENRFDSGG